MSRTKSESSDGEIFSITLMLVRLKKWAKLLAFLLVTIIALQCVHFGFTLLRPQPFAHMTMADGSSSAEKSAESASSGARNARAVKTDGPISLDVPAKTGDQITSIAENLDELIERVTLRDYMDPNYACPTVKPGLSIYQHIGPEEEYSTCYYVSELKE